MQLFRRFKTVNPTWVFTNKIEKIRFKIKKDLE